MPEPQCDKRALIKEPYIAETEAQSANELTASLFLLNRDEGEVLTSLRENHEEAIASTKERYNSQRKILESRIEAARKREKEEPKNAE